MHRWKADRQVGHPVTLAGPAQMIGRAFYSTTASTGDISLFFFRLLQSAVVAMLVKGALNSE